MLTKAPKGTKDILPQESYKWHFIEEIFRDICHRHGFEEIRTPIFEHTELFIRGVGDGTDIVQKEMYSWEQAKRSLTLRPEGTSPVVRALVEHNLYANPQPTKLYYDVSCFRYERPQSGRQRQFHQFGAEVFGTENMMADSEIIALAHDILKELGLKNFKLNINSIGCPKCRPKYREALLSYLENKSSELCHQCQIRKNTNPMRVLDCKEEKCQDITKDVPVMLDYLCDECSNSFKDLQRNLEAMDIEFTVNPKIVRGLDYYTKTAFEFISDSIGAQSTICGGGRYDHLTQELGGPPIPGVGFGLGKERLLLFMESEGIVLENSKEVDLFVAYMGDEPKMEAIKLSQNLRRKGLKVEIDSLGRNLKGQFKYADRINAKYTIVIGEDELSKGKLVIKNMKESQQREVDNNIEAIMEAVKGAKNL